MSLASKVCTFALGMVGCTAVGVGYGLANKLRTVKPKSLATHQDDLKCEKGRAYCVTDEGRVHVNFVGKPINKRPA